MREDMAKVVTERPRSGPRVKAPKGEHRRRDWEERHGCEPYSEKIGRKWHSWEGKNFTDVLGPLYGYLLKQVGRPWDKVYSEICRHLPADSVQGSHIRDHVFQFVELHVKMIDGKPYNSEGTYPIHHYNRGYPFGLYVNPVTGLLCKLKAEPLPRRKRTFAGVPVPGVTDRQYHKIEGVWYELTLKSVASPEPEINSRIYYTRQNIRWSSSRYELHSDVGYKKELSYSERYELYGGDFVATAKRQLNSKEIKRAGLR